MIKDAIKGVKNQLLYEPIVQNADRLGVTAKFVVAGMGGSALAADLLRIYEPGIDLVIHRSYGLPELTEESWKNRLFIASSYSGNTEETISALEEARKKDIAAAVISVGGKLIALAKQFGIPYVELPDTNIQPRMAIGFSMKALLKLMGKETEIEALRVLGDRFDPMALEEGGKHIAETLKNSIPIIYASYRNRPLAYDWKITFNETGKIPAFANTFSELNHNEMEGFDIQDATRELSSKMCVVMLRDENDHPRLRKRMEATEKLLAAKGMRIINIDLGTGTLFEKMFRSATLVMWAAYHTAEGYKVEAEAVPMVEEFKRLIAE